jgi:ribonuclease Z
MKPTFHVRPVNGPFEDPCVYARIIREKRALLFDLGRLERLEIGNLLKITDIFVTHMHMDHFAGFDTVLRGVLKRDIPLRIFGPENIIE